MGRSRSCARDLLYISICVLVFGNLKMVNAESQHEKADLDDIDREIEALKNAARKKVDTEWTESRTCTTSSLKEIQWCTNESKDKTTISSDVEHGEKCIQYLEGHYITKQCVDGSWRDIKMVKKNVQKKGWLWRRRRSRYRRCRWWSWRRPRNTAPYFTRCRPSTTTFYTPAGSTGMRVTWPLPSAYDREDGYVSVRPVKRRRRRYCRGWWWWRSCYYTYYPHYGDYFTASTRGTYYSIAYSARDRRGASASCSFYILVKMSFCTTPYAPAYGSVSCPSGTYLGRTCYFSCRYGYTASVSSTYCGSNGAWSNGNTFQCTPTVTCSSTNRPVIANGYHSCPSYYAGTTCYPACNSGYALTGVRYPAICQSTGVWYRAASPVCADNSPPTIANCPSSISKISDSGKTSAVVTWTAPTATDNHDSTNPVPVKITGNINSGDRVEAGITHTIVYAATDVAGNQAKCTFTVIVRTVSCSTLSAISNGHYSSCTHGFIYGSTCTYSCNKGYELQGTSVLACQAVGTWSAAIPSCSIKTCSAPESLGHTIGNGQYHCPASIVYLTVCNAVCTTGYHLEQTSTIECTVDSSNNPLYNVTGTAECKDKTPPTFDDCDGTKSFNLEANKGTTTAAVAYDLPAATDIVDESPSVQKIEGPNIGDILDESEAAVVRFQATDASGNPSAVCTYQLSVKVIKCSDQVPPTGGNIACTADYIYGSVCSLTCTTGYELVDGSTVECLEDATWSASFDCQQIFCPGPPANPDHGYYTCQSTTATYPYATTCTAYCNNGFLLEQQTHTQCIADKTWQALVDPVCIDVEPPVIQGCEDQLTFTANKGSRSASVTWIVPTATDNVDSNPPVVQLSGPTIDSVVTGEATVKFQATDSAGVKSNVCTTRIVVEVIECNGPTRPTHGQYSCDKDSIYGSTCTYTCNTGYELSANGIVECQSDRTWSYGETAPTCDIITCGAPETREKGAFVCPDENYEYLTDCSLQCETGFDTSTTVKAQCQATKAWSYTSEENCLDATPPTFSTCNTYQTAYAGKLSNGANVNWEVPSAVDNHDSAEQITIEKLSGPDLGDFLEVGETGVIYRAVDRNGNPSVENCNITLNVEDIVCNHPSATFNDTELGFECVSYKYGVTCTISCNITTHLLNGTSSTVCEANFVNDKPSTYWDYVGEYQPFCKELTCPNTLHTPNNGAIVVTDGAFPIAYFSCNDNYDTAYSFNGVSYCKSDGNGGGYWDPAVIPDCSRTKRSFSLLQTEFYYNGDCSSETTKDYLQQFVLNKQSDFVNIPSLSFKSVTVFCPDASSVKKREVGDKQETNMRVKRSTNQIKIVIVLTVSRNIGTIDDLIFVEDTLAASVSRLRELLGNGAFDTEGFTTIVSSFVEKEYTLNCSEGQILSGILCKDCAVGRYLNTPASGAATCEWCPVGTYADGESQTECTQCPEGTSTKGIGSKTSDMCIAHCEAGEVSPNGLQPCVPCPLNEYQSLTGKSTCESCPAQQRTFKTDSTACSHYDIVLNAGIDTHILTETQESLAGFSFAFWYKKTSEDNVTVSVTEASGTKIISVTLGLQGEVNYGSTYETFELPPSNVWSHIAVSLHDLMVVYTNGTIIYSSPIAIVVDAGSQINIGVGSLSDIRLSGLGLYTTILDSTIVSDLYSSCLLGTTVALFGSDDFVGLNLQNVDVKPATCIAEDTCLINPCNSHLCTPTINGPACTCNNGYSGQFCSVEPDNCYGIDCNNGGTCVNSVSGFTCTCTNGFTGLHCDDPPVAGDWTGWSEWSTCTAKCDGGTQQRTRSCTNPPPDEHGTDCSGSSVEEQPCNTITCLELNPCLSSPCVSGSTCTETNSMFQCTCQPGYTGSTCDVTLDQCDTNDCENGATCVSLDDGYSCTCTSQYTGTYCQTELVDTHFWTSWSACTATCGGGTSTRTRQCVPASVESSCQSTMETKTCNTEVCVVDHCLSSPCGAHTCLNEAAQFRCVCTTGYTGTTCSETIDHCSGVSCGPGTCVNSLTGFTCDCPEGYTGTGCSDGPVAGGWSDWTEWSECSDACAGGTKSRTRECNNPEPGVGGANCLGEEQAVEECSIDCSDSCQSSPCGTGGNCVVAASGVVCQCEDGYTGSLCDTLINPCDPNPCDNGGQCSGTGTTFTCSCVDGYSGDTCDMEPDVSVWEVWSQWGECSLTCGTGGVKTRNRTCNEGTTGEDCVGEAADTESCNEEVECNECSDLPRRYGVVVNCTNNITNDGKICDVNCRGDLVVANGSGIDAIGRYQCGIDTGYEWDHNVTLIPTCAAKRSADRFKVSTALSTSTPVSCSKADQVAAGYKESLASSPCGLSNSCQTTVQVSGCTNSGRRKKDTSTSTVTFEFVYNVTSNDTESGDSEVAIFDMEDTMFLLENGTAESLTIVVDGEAISLDNSNISITPTVECPEGYLINEESCVACSPGTHYDSALGFCVECEQSYYQDQTGQTSCIYCGEGYITNTTGSYEASDCIFIPPEAYQYMPQEVTAATINTEDSSVSAGVIGGAVGGGVLALIIIVIAIVIWKKKMNALKRVSDSNVWSNTIDEHVMSSTPHHEAASLSFAATNFAHIEQKNLHFERSKTPNNLVREHTGPWSRPVSRGDISMMEMDGNEDMYNY